MRQRLHKSTRREVLKVGLLLTVLALPRARGESGDFATVKSVDGMKVLLGVVPSQILRQGAADGHSIPAGRGHHHVLLAVFDEHTGERLADLQVSARVENLGRTVVEDKPLDVMLTNRLVSFGNFFAMPGGDTFRIHIKIRRHHITSEITFNYQHP